MLSLLWLASLAVRVAIVGTHSPVGRLASISATSRRLTVAKIDKKNTGLVLHEPNRFAILLVDATAVTPDGLYSLQLLHPNASLHVMHDASDVSLALDQVEKVIKNSG